MIPKLGFLLLIILFSSFQPDSFKDSQLKYQRVRQAYKDKEADLLVHFTSEPDQCQRITDPIKGL
jgi:hypothetical protein